jgi:hypothetical protein
VPVGTRSNFDVKAKAKKDDPMLKPGKAKGGKKMPFKKAMPKKAGKKKPAKKGGKSDNPFLKNKK